MNYSFDLHIHSCLTPYGGDAMTPKNIAEMCSHAGYDIVAHAVESYVATGAGSISRSLAGDAFACAIRLLPASFACCAKVAPNSPAPTIR